MLRMKLFAAIAVMLLGSFIADAANTIVNIKTSMGIITVELFDDQAPHTVKNFLTYVDDKFYDGTIFHRV
ncbi:MAG: peptidylprolyl isomerase, partial [Victivallaceae bacterium]